MYGEGFTYLQPYLFKVHTFIQNYAFMVKDVPILNPIYSKLHMYCERLTYPQHYLFIITHMVKGCTYPQPYIFIINREW